ncbi:MAG: hypothetical protein ACPGKS_08355 [Coraliomargarita sp.]
MELGSLKKDLEVITQQSEPANGESFAAVLKRVDSVATTPGLPERLQHYLSKRSYVKALAWLDDPNLPHLV